MQMICVYDCMYDRVFVYYSFNLPTYYTCTCIKFKSQHFDITVPLGRLSIVLYFSLLENRQKEINVLILRLHCIICVNYYLHKFLSIFVAKK